MAKHKSSLLGPIVTKMSPNSFLSLPYLRLSYWFYIIIVSCNSYNYYILGAIPSYCYNLVLLYSSSANVLARRISFFIPYYFKAAHSYFIIKLALYRAAICYL